MSFKTRKTSEIDFFNLIIDESCRIRKILPEPLPWIEPSINMLYLNSVVSLILGQSFASIICMCILLEHTLRMAVIDVEKAGIQRRVSKAKINRYQSINDIFQDEKLKSLLDYLIPKEEDKKWWKEIAGFMRNKSAHYLIPHLLAKFGGEDYMGSFRLHSKYEKIDYTDPHTWGHLYHRVSDKLAIMFFEEATEQLRRLISNTLWAPDRSWWKSQEGLYNLFYEYKWEPENMIKSIQKIL